MDIRKTTEFQEKQKQKLEELQKQEISARNILATLNTLEELRHNVYSEYKVGSQGIMNLMIMTSCVMSVVTLSGRFAKTFPRVSGILGQSYMPRIVLVYLSMTLGRTLEKYRVDHHLNPEAYKEYISVYNYYRSLKTRKVQSVDWVERLEVLFGVHLRQWVPEVFSTQEE
mmetsp:Transcript_13594/g.19855  ORF Transcript_13594/g.19855 Transcript_13594/m.19855 type:complete len:170 (+) Transcript_13594:22-531(+)